MSEVGQDGVVAVAALVPATVEIEIRDSTIEKAGQMNIEGTILNVPPSDPARAHESIVSIDVKGSVIRDVGFVDGFRKKRRTYGSLRRFSLLDGSPRGVTISPLLIRPWRKRFRPASGSVTPALSMESQRTKANTRCICETTRFGTTVPRSLPLLHRKPASTPGRTTGAFLRDLPRAALSCSTRPFCRKSIRRSRLPARWKERGPARASWQIHRPSIRGTHHRNDSPDPCPA